MYLPQRSIASSTSIWASFGSPPRTSENPQSEVPRKTLPRTRVNKVLLAVCQIEAEASSPAEQLQQVRPELLYAPHLLLRGVRVECHVAYVGGYDPHDPN